MDTVTQPHSSSAPSTRKRWDAGIRAGVISALLAFLALVVAVLAWLWPQQPAGAPTTADSGPVTTPGKTNSGPAAMPTDPGVPVSYLDNGDFPPEAGGSDVVELPRAIRNDPRYTSHPVAIKCPTNQTGDQSSDVTFLLRGQYAQIDATVHPYYPAGTDQQSATYVTALIGIRQPDGRLDFTKAGDQKRANPAGPASFTAAVDKAEKLILRVECGNPAGTIVLTDVRLTRA